MLVISPLNVKIQSEAELNGAPAPLSWLFLPAASSQQGGLTGGEPHHEVAIYFHLQYFGRVFSSQINGGILLLKLQNMFPLTSLMMLR